MIAIPYALVCVFVISFCYYSKYQFSDERGQSAVRGKWHIWGAIMRACVVGICVHAHGLRDGFLIGAIVLPLFDCGINIIALDENLFHVGTTDSFDKKIGMWKWPIYLLLLLAAIYVKFFTK